MHIIRPQSKQPMPPHARCVFKGKIFDVYQWEQNGYDGSMHVFEKIKRPDTVVAIAVTEDKQILMTKQEQPGKDPFIGLAGGRVDEGEDPLTAVQRELLEETGYVSRNWELFMSLQPMSKVEWAVYYFIARDCKRVAGQSLDGAEKVEVMPVSFDTMLEFALRKDFYEQELFVRILEAKSDPHKMQELRNTILGPQ